MTNEEQINLLRIQNLQLELEIKQVELLAKQKELDNIKAPKKRISLELLAILATIIVAIIAFIGSYIASTVQGQYLVKQKEQEFEAALITKAVEAGDSSVSRRNLKFLMDAGLINDRNGKIKSIVIDTSYILPHFGTAINTMLDKHFYVNPGGSKFHMPNCRMVGDLSQEITFAKIVEMGLGPCKICRPSSIHEVVQCKALTKLGTRCKHFTSIGNGFCFQHQPN